MAASEPPSTSRSTRRRWAIRVTVYSALLSAALVFLLHPYLRQTLFGPKVRDVPLCYWQDEVRAASAPHGYRYSAMAEFLEAVGLRKRRQEGFVPFDADMLPVYLSLLDDPSAKVRATLSNRLANLPASPETDAALLRLLDDPDPDVRGETAFDIVRGRPDFRAALPRLTALMDDPRDPQNALAACAAYIISEKKLNRALPVLTAALGHSEKSIRHGAILALCELGERADETLPALAAHLIKEPDFPNRMEGCRYLFKYGRPAVPVLIQLTKDSHMRVRWCAAGGLGKLGPAARDAIAALEALADDADPDVCAAAASALSRIDAERYPEERSEP